MTHPQLSAAWRIEMGGFHDQYGNYRPDLVADARQAGIDRLCAELANARLERDNIASLNSSLIAELAEAKARIAELKRQVGERETELEAVFARAERAEARIAELEAKVVSEQKAYARCASSHDYLHNSRDDERARAERAEAKIAEAMDRLCYTAGECDLVTACEHWVANLHETEARAKRAEAELADTKVHLTRVISDFSTYVYRAEAELAAKDARIAESDKMVADLETECIEKDRLTADMLESRNKRIAELEAERAKLSSFHDMLIKLSQALARAERAEAALSFYADERNWHTPPHCYPAAVSDCGTKARAAFAPSPTTKVCNE